MDLLYPRFLKQSDQVCIIDPANAFTEEGIRNAMQLLEAQKFRVRISEDMAFKRGTGKERARRLNQEIENSDNSALLCMWGGYGTLNLLEHINYKALKENRPVFAGFSDITAMHTAIRQKTGLITFHSPALYSPKRPVTAEASNLFMEMIQYPEKWGTLANLNQEPMQTFRDGVATGKLVGGNLTLISRLMGTPYELDTTGNLLFLEEIGERPYRLHGMLYQLKLSGKLDEAAGIILGSFNGCDDEGRNGSGLEAVFSVLKDVKCPVIYNVRAGHICDPLTLPLGAMATIDGNRLIILSKEA